MAAAHAFHPNQYGIAGRSRQLAVLDIAKRAQTAGFLLGGELDSTDHFVHINPRRAVTAYGIDEDTINRVITNRGKEKNHHLTLSNALARKHKKQALDHATRGLPQGAASSPVIASASLTKAIEAFSKEWDGRALLFNYADNFYLFARDKADWDEASQTFIATMSAEEDLTIRVRQPCIHLSAGFDILGYSLVYRKGCVEIRIPAKRKREIMDDWSQKRRELATAIKTDDSLYEQIFQEAAAVIIIRLSRFVAAQQDFVSMAVDMSSDLLQYHNTRSARIDDVVRVAKFLQRRVFNTRSS